MKIKSTGPLARSKPSEDDIRNYAYHLYQQSNYLPGQDLANWLEASACLLANIPAHRSGTRLHHHINGSEDGAESDLESGVESSVASDERTAVSRKVRGLVF